jgi:hypothetical protein
MPKRVGGAKPSWDTPLMPPKLVRQALCGRDDEAAMMERLEEAWGTAPGAPHRGPTVVRRATSSSGSRSSPPD